MSENKETPQEVATETVADPAIVKSTRHYRFFPVILGISLSAILGAVIAYGFLVGGVGDGDDRLPLLEAEGPLKMVPDGPKITPEPHRDSTLFGVLDPSNAENGNVERLSEPTETPNLTSIPPPKILPQETPKPQQQKTDGVPKTQKTTRSGWYVQIAAFRQESQLKEQWKKLQSGFPNLFTNANHISQKITIDGQGIFYRLLLGPYNKRENADHLCNQLKQKNQDCLVRQLNF